jgi:hypothetical protein
MDITNIDFIEFNDARKILEFFSAENDMLSRFVKIYKKNMENSIYLDFDDGEWSTSKKPVTISTDGSQYIKLIVLEGCFSIKYNNTKTDVIRGNTFTNIYNINIPEFTIIPETGQKCYYILYRSIKKI